MIHTLAARALLMIAQGVRTIDAIDWVLHRFHRNMLSYWRTLLLREICAALA